MDHPVFSIICASYLGSYPGAATNREEKFIRAVDSVLTQTLKSWELIVIADGCQKTMEILNQKYALYNHNISAYLIAKQKTFSGKVRNVGIKNAIGDWITYLDTDDCLGPDHLKILYQTIQSKPDAAWLYYNDLAQKSGVWHERTVDMMRKGRHGTANITHKRSLQVYWTDESYDHDRIFVNELKKHSPAVASPTPQYFVCHIPGKYDI